ncbi:MAG: septal ring lytic transglycosylase RlpA family protein [Alphaproteobacteria bacterium]|nr:septal ring lytic transglycosylase RlpA family protein [Alphaproteobacteria bacterium]
MFSTPRSQIGRSLPVLLFSICAAALVGCGGLPGSGLFKRHNDVDAGGGDYKVGQPYRVNGRWYYPKEDLGYVETGTASWYGRQFHGRRTASGEIFDMNAMTAAHPTLPMPSFVKVTNLDNGRRAILRINDRGPFSNGRIIDLSRAAAQELDFIGTGTAPVRVEILPEQSRQAKIAALGNDGGPAPRSAPRDEIATVALEAPPEPVRPAPEIVTRAPELILVARGQTAGGVFIQTGAYREYANATRARDRVAGLGLGETRIQEAYVKGALYYRVRIGPLGDERTAQAMLAGASGSRIPGARVVLE